MSDMSESDTELDLEQFARDMNIIIDEHDCHDENDSHSDEAAAASMASSSAATVEAAAPKRRRGRPRAQNDVRHSHVPVGAPTTGRKSCSASAASYRV